MRTGFVPIAAPKKNDDTANEASSQIDEDFSEEFSDEMAQSLLETYVQSLNEYDEEQVLLAEESFSNYLYPPSNNEHPQPYHKNDNFRHLEEKIWFYEESFVKH